MGKRQNSGSGNSASDPADEAAATVDVDMVGYIDTAPGDDVAPAAADALSDPIVALTDDGQERPLSGGSFVRQPDGTLIRIQEA